MKLVNSSLSDLAMFQKLICFAESEKQAAQLQVGYPNSSNDAMPPSDVRRRDLNVM
jgi:hypothetical protein